MLHDRLLIPGNTKLVVQIWSISDCGLAQLDNPHIDVQAAAQVVTSVRWLIIDT